MDTRFTAHIGLIEDLQDVGRSQIGDLSKHITFQGGNVHLLGGESSHLTAFERDCVYVGKNKLELPLQVSQLRADRSFVVSQILSMLNTDTISLNHLGIRYQVDDIDAEVKRIQSEMKGDVYKVFEDEEGQKENMRWLFIGAEDKKNPGKPRIDTPMMEIVLPHPDEAIPPHFQFDVDTDLTQQDIERRIQSGTRLPNDEELFTWSLSLPDTGKVLSMGPYNNMNGINYEVGIGNHKRSRKAHRNEMIMIT